MAEIAFTDGQGPATLSNGAPAPGDRFRAWVPLQVIIGPIHHALGTGIPHVWAHRTDYGAKFSIGQIPDSEQEIAARLVLHLLSGGAVDIDTDDAGGNVYSTCYLWPGSTPELSAPDRTDLRRTLTLSILQPGATTPLVCHYS